LSLRNVPYKYLVATGFIFGLFMDLMDLTVVNVALPTFGEKFHASDATLQWVVTGYLLSLAIWIPASGWIGDRFGTKRTFLFALLMFTVASAACGLSWNVGSLITFRLIQGIGGGMMTPVGTAMLFRAFPPAERARASLILTVPTVIAPGIGPIIGGWLIDYVSWRWIFYINVPLGIIGFIFCLMYLQEHKEKAPGRFDVPGFILSAAGLALVLFALSRGPEDGWGSAGVLGTGVVGVFCFIALVFVELRQSEPMLDLRLFSDRMFRTANIVYFTASGSLLGVLFLVPLFLQQLRGFSAIETGLVLLPSAIGTIVFAQLSGRLYPIVGPRRLLAVALTMFAVSSGMLLFVGLNTNIWWVAGIMFVRGIGIAFTFIPLQAATFATISSESTGRASSIFNTNRQVGASFGVAILATVLAERISSHLQSVPAGASASVQQAAANHAQLLAFHDAFFAAVVLGVVGVAFAFLIHDEDALSTMRSGATAGAAEAAPAVH